MHGSPTTPRRSLAPASTRTSRALEAKLDALRQDPTARNALAARVQRPPRSGHKDLLRRVPPPRPWSAVAPEPTVPPPFSETLQRPASALYSARGPRPNPVDAPAVLREPRRHLLEQGGPLKFGRREVAGCARPPTRELEGVQLSPRVAKAGFAGPLWQPASARPAWRGRPSLAGHAGVDVAAALGARRAPEPGAADGEVAAADTAERIAAASAARERQQRKRAEVAALASAVASLRGALEHGAPPAYSEALEDARLDLERRYAVAAGLDATPRRRGGTSAARRAGLSDAEMRLGRAAISTGLSSSRRR